MSNFERSRVAQVVWPWMTAEGPGSQMPSCRKRAVIQAALMLAFSALISLRSHHMAVTVAGMAVFVLVSGLFVPRAFWAVERGFKAFGRFVGLALTWILLVPFFALVFVPGRLCLLLSGKDPLTRSFPAKERSCWQPHVVRKNDNHYTKQYK
jgi:hypothetical protein